MNPLFEASAYNGNDVKRRKLGGTQIEKRDIEEDLVMCEMLLNQPQSKDFLLGLSVVMRNGLR